MRNISDRDKTSKWLWWLCGNPNYFSIISSTEAIFTVMLYIEVYWIYFITLINSSHCHLEHQSLWIRIEETHCFPNSSPKSFWHSAPLWLISLPISHKAAYLPNWSTMVRWPHPLRWTSQQVWSGLEQSLVLSTAGGINTCSHLRLWCGYNLACCVE